MRVRAASCQVAVILNCFGDFEQKLDLLISKPDIFYCQCNLFEHLLDQVCLIAAVLKRVARAWLASGCGCGTLFGYNYSSSAVSRANQQGWQSLDFLGRAISSAQAAFPFQGHSCRSPDGTMAEQAQNRFLHRAALHGVFLTLAVTATIPGGLYLRKPIYVGQLMGTAPMGLFCFGRCGCSGWPGS